MSTNGRERGNGREKERIRHSALNCGCRESNSEALHMHQKVNPVLSIGYIFDVTLLLFVYRTKRFKIINVKSSFLAIAL